MGGVDWKGAEAFGDARHTDILPSKYHRMDVDDRRIDLDEVLPLVKNSCRYCQDMTAEFADLSIGGARSTEGWNVDRGWNQLIVRSKKGEELVKLALRTGQLEFRPFGDDKALVAALHKLKNASEAKKNKADKY